MRTKLNLSILIALPVIINSCINPNSPTASLVIVNANLVTLDEAYPTAQAIAIMQDSVVAIGNSEEIQSLIGKETKVIDAQGKLLLPGFNDAHAHFGPLDPEYIELRYITDPDIITRKVKSMVSRVNPGDLIRGGHWEHEMFDNPVWPTKELLDEVSPDNPVILTRADAHSALVNSYVLKYSGITRNTLDPFGGEIQKHPKTGEPTGILKESAMKLIKYPKNHYQRSVEETRELEKEGWILALKEAAKYGVTSIQLPGDGYDQIKQYDELLKSGKLSVRIDLSAPLTLDKDTLAFYQDLAEKYPRSNKWLRFGYLKDFLDGTLGSATMMVFDPFLDDPGNTGLAQMPYQTLVKKIFTAELHGFQVGIHAIGPKANHWVLNAVEEIKAKSKVKDPRHRIEHAQILSKADIPRFGKLGVIASMQPTHCITDKRFCEKRIGKDRCKGGYAWKSLLNNGAHLAFGTDYTVEPLNPMEGIYAAVTRKDRLGEEGEGWFPDEKLSVIEAVEQYTKGSAYAQFMEDRKGMLKPGYLADIVILNQDIFSIPPSEILKTKVDLTIVGGKVVYNRNLSDKKY